MGRVLIHDTSGLRCFFWCGWYADHPPLCLLTQAHVTPFGGQKTRSHTGVPAWEQAEREWGGTGLQAAFVSQKIFEISSIFVSSRSAEASSSEPLVPPAPASLVASLNSVCSCGYFSKCGALK
jgi:hypothetical protein